MWLGELVAAIKEGKVGLIGTATARPAGDEPDVCLMPSSRGPHRPPPNRRRAFTPRGSATIRLEARIMAVDRIWDRMWRLFRRRRLPPNWRRLQLIGRLLDDAGRDEEEWLPWIETGFGFSDDEVRLIGIGSEVLLPARAADVCRHTTETVQLAVQLLGIGDALRPELLPTHRAAAAPWWFHDVCSFSFSFAGATPSVTPAQGPSWAHPAPEAPPSTSPSKNTPAACLS